MEEELLNQMIRDRDKKIAEVKDVIEGRKDEMAKIRQELTRLRAEASENRLQYRREVAKLTKSGTDLQQQMQRLEEEVQSQNGSLHIYAEVLREAAPDSVDSSYVLRMQSQLCKAMHSMGIMEHQMALVKDGSSALVKALKESINGVVEEKSKIELECMNRMMEIDNARRHAEEEFQGEMDKTKEELPDIETLPTPDAKEEEGEAKLSKEQMNEYLDELHDAIEEMTEKTEAQQKKINELKGLIQESKKKIEPVEPESEEAGDDEAPQHEADTSAVKEATADAKVNEDEEQLESDEAATTDENGGVEDGDEPTDDSAVVEEPVHAEDEGVEAEGDATEEKVAQQSPADDTAPDSPAEQLEEQ